jgi:hypothetical protein
VCDVCVGVHCCAPHECQYTMQLTSHTVIYSQPAVSASRLATRSQLVPAAEASAQLSEVKLYY